MLLENLRDVSPGCWFDRPAGSADQQESFDETCGTFCGTFCQIFFMPAGARKSA
jgi:hypothetical protein